MTRAVWWRAVLYGLAILYLGADLFLLHGPLFRITRRAPNRGTPPTTVVAVVNGIALHRDRLEAEVAAHLARRGRNPDDLSPEALALSRRAVLNHLIEDELVRRRVELAGEAFAYEPPPSQPHPALLDAFPTTESLQQALRQAGVEHRELLERLVEEDRVTAWIERQIAPHLTVTEAENRAWFARHRESLRIPETFQVRHLFLATTRADPALQEKRIREWHAQVRAGKATVESLVRAHSEDDGTREQGGIMAPFNEDRMPPPFLEAVRSLAPGEVSDPFRTPIGWHIVELLHRSPDRDPDWEEVREEIAAHLANTKRLSAVARLIKTLRNESDIHVFYDNL